MKEPIMTYALWTVQGLLALIFLFIGGKKLVLLPEAMTEQMRCRCRRWSRWWWGLLSALVAYGRRRPTLHRKPTGAHEADYGHRPLSVGPMAVGNEC